MHIKSERKFLTIGANSKAHVGVAVAAGFDRDGGVGGVDEGDVAFENDAIFELHGTLDAQAAAA
jgi:hypothetical protein